MTAVDTNQYDYEAFIAERAVRHHEQRQAAQLPYTEYDAYLDRIRQADADDQAEAAAIDAQVAQYDAAEAERESLDNAEPPLSPDEVEAEATRQPWAETVANIRNYPEAWRPFIHRPQQGDWGAAS